MESDSSSCQSLGFVQAISHTTLAGTTRPRASHPWRGLVFNHDGAKDLWHVCQASPTRAARHQPTCGGQCGVVKSHHGWAQQR